MLVIVDFYVVNEWKLSPSVHVKDIYGNNKCKIESFYVDCEPCTNLVFASFCRTLYGQRTRRSQCFSRCPGCVH